ncbi:NAD(P)H-hydrate epimerase [Candidatus Woesearchaeota archaeon]|nr:NAD(P)H-hydrate epimerase [Candidatus Woesearchaeota archaeon]
MINTQKMRELEESCGIPKRILMENAGREVASVISKKIDTKNKKFLVVSYHGSNGGDGFVAARHLCNDAEVDVLFVGDERKLKHASLTNFRKIENNEMIQLLNMETVDFDEYDIIIDAIFGTGVKTEIKEPLATLIKNITNSKAYKVSIDVPTGIHPDTGEKANVHFEPDLIITLHDIKEGLAAYKDKTVVVDIGLGKSQ